MTYMLIDNCANNLGYFDVEINSDHVGICPVLPIELDGIKLSSISKHKVFLTKGYALVKVSQKQKDKKNEQNQ